MGKVGVANLPLHPGKAPPWLFKRMTKLASCIVKVIVDEYGTPALLEKVSDPYWFQAFGCVLGFDWHSSGLTTVTGGAMKEALNFDDHGLAVAGGKGRASRKTIQDLEAIGAKADLGTQGVQGLQWSSRMCAKVDSAALQDGHQLYYHIMLVASDGEWAVVQQGLDDSTGYARRYHWLSDGLDSYIVEPHEGIIGERRPLVLDMTAKASIPCQRASVDLVNDGPNRLMSMLKEPVMKKQSTLEEFLPPSERPALLTMPKSINWNLVRQLYEFHPKGYEDLLAFKGVGPSTVRALALISEVVHGTPPSFRDPVKFSFAVGGKDGVPFPVDRKAYDRSIDVLREGIEDSRAGDNEKLDAVKRLRAFVPADYNG